VCWEVNSANENRETEGLLEAMNILGLQKGCIITYNQEDQLVKDGKIIKLVPAWKWITDF
jgi:predicted AAA+ superfamily ATPase